MFDVERSMFDVYLFHAKQIPSGDSQSLILWARIFYFTLCHCAFAPLCLSSYMITKEKISVIVSVDRWLSALIRKYGDVFNI